MIKERNEFSFINETPFTAMDRMLLRHLRDDWGESNYWILVASVFCNLAVREGHTFLDLANPQISSVPVPRSWPRVEYWQSVFAESRIVSSAESNQSKPLVLSSDNCLYLEKYYTFEKELAAAIIDRCQTAAEGTEDLDPVERAAKRRFFVITGGPGTGKTTLALRYLNTLIGGWSEDRPARFAAIAPTGKAAARLAESITTGIGRLNLSSDRKKVLKEIPCLTIHRLLGSLPHRSSFRRNQEKPLRYDTLVVDESSMIDLPLMLRLFKALPNNCQVLLLGDKDQLASVNVGSVLSDILKASEKPDSNLSNSVERLRKTYRFSEDSGIYRACQYAKNGEIDHFRKMLLSPPASDFHFTAIKSDARAIPNSAVRVALDHWKSLTSCASAPLALEKLNEAITLSSTKQGPFGTNEFNRRLERASRDELGFDSDQAIHGCPIIVLENNYELELFNGDLGLVWLEDDGQAVVYFPSTAGEPRRFRLADLPRHESAFALTIHKSQGSEFDHVNCLFGPESGNHLTRELVYTAFSRAKEKVRVFGSVDNLIESIGKTASRATRLAKLLVK